MFLIFSQFHQIHCRQNHNTTNPSITKSESSSTLVEHSSTTQRRKPLRRSTRTMFISWDSSPSNKQPKMHSITMMQLARDEEDMRRVVDLVCAWRCLTAEEFVCEWPPLSFILNTLHHPFSGHCEQLDCPHLALEVFGNYAKYDITNTGRYPLRSCPPHLRSS